MLIYNPANWYWSGSPGVFSSASGALVPSTNAAYVAWVAAGGYATPWPRDASGNQTTQALDAVLSPYGLSTGLSPLTQAQLIAYNFTEAAAVRAVARAYTLATGVSVLCDSTDSRGASVAGLSALGSANPTASYGWIDNNGLVTQITGTQAVLLGVLVATYAQSVFKIAGTVSTAILAGTVTTTAQIDAAAWPA